MALAACSVDRTYTSIVLEEDLRRLSHDRLYFGFGHACVEPTSQVYGACLTTKCQPRDSDQQDESTAGVLQPMSTPADFIRWPGRPTPELSQESVLNT